MHFGKITPALRQDHPSPGLGPGFALVVGATVLILSGSAGNNDGTTDGGAVGLGIVLLFLGGPTLLVGVIAVGVRLGLRDDAASLPRRTRDSYSRSGEAAFPDIRSRLLHGKAVSRLGT